MKSRSLAKRALEMAMRSMMGTTCSARDSGCDSHSHILALNLKIRRILNDAAEQKGPVEEHLRGTLRPYFGQQEADSISMS